MQTLPVRRAVRSRQASGRQVASRFASRKAIELRADTRTAAQRHVDELILAGIIGRTRPMWAGERTAEVMQEILQHSPPLPWTIEWEDDHE